MATGATLAALVRDDIAAALAEVDHSMRMTLLRDAGRAAFDLAYEDHGGPPGQAEQAAMAFLNTLNGAMAMTFPAEDREAQIERIASIWGVAANNAAALAAAPRDVRRTWITMLDDRVRDTHAPMHGTSIGPGESFVVGGFPLRYPGEPIGPPEVWINCRCTLGIGADLIAAGDRHESVIVVAVPADPSSLTVGGGDPAEDMHVTLGFYGDVDAAPDGLREALGSWVGAQPSPGEAKVSGVGRIGDDDPQATVLLVESPTLQAMRDELVALAPPDSTHPHYVPHLTLGYGIEMPATTPDVVPLERVELWWGEDRTGGVISQDSQNSHNSELSETADALVARSYSAEQRRKMAARGTALPDGSFPIADVEDLRNAIQAIGRASDPDKARRHIRKRARALGATNLIPESWTASVPDPATGNYTVTKGGVTVTTDSLVAVNTHDAPGWLTHPRETQRLRNYWTKGAGAAKIRWGSPGDLTRCHKHLQKYVGPFAWGTCNNLHHVVFGKFNPESGRKGRRGTLAADGMPEPSPDELAVVPMIDAAFAALDEMGDDMPEELPPLEWFEDPHFSGPTPLTIEADGHVYGHAASWDQCHMGFDDRCVTAPHSERGYNHFRTGAVQTAGGVVSVGNITMDTGHAPKGLGSTAAVAHYDDTGTVVADVAAGEDAYGVWLNGQIRPGVDPDKVRALQAASISGDWRQIGGKLEFVAALAVNVPGFPIPRPELAASAAGDEIYALTAAAIVTVDPNAITERVAVAVVARLDEREAARDRARRARALQRIANGPRVAALSAAMADLG